MSEPTIILSPEEVILWKQKPLAKSFVLPSLGFVPFALFFLSIILVMIWASGGLMFGSEIYFLYGIIALLVLIPPAWQILRCRNTEYLMTNKRIIIQSGVFGKNTRYIDMSKIQEAHVEAGFVDRIFGTGSILIVTAGQAAMGNIGGDTITWNMKGIPTVTPGISAIRNPYETLKLLNETAEQTKQK